MIEGSLKVQLPTIWTHGKAEVGRVREEKGRRKKNQRRERQKTEDPGVQKGKRVAKHCVVPMFCGSGGSKSRFAKAAVAESSCQLNDGVEMSKKCAPLWHEAHFEAKTRKHTMFGRLLELEIFKTCMPLWRETYFEVKMVENGRNTAGSEPFWQWRCPKSVKRSTFRSQNMTNTSGLEPF